MRPCTLRLAERIGKVKMYKRANSFPSNNQAHVAQWIRHRPPKPRIVGSSPTVGKLFRFFFTCRNVILNVKDL